MTGDRKRAPLLSGAVSSNVGKSGGERGRRASRTEIRSPRDFRAPFARIAAPKLPPDLGELSRLRRKSERERVEVTERAIYDNNSFRLFFYSLQRERSVIISSLDWPK